MQMQKLAPRVMGQELIETPIYISVCNNLEFCKYLDICNNSRFRDTHRPSKSFSSFLLQNPFLPLLSFRSAVGQFFKLKGRCIVDVTRFKHFIHFFLCNRGWGFNFFFIINGLVKMQKIIKQRSAKTFPVIFAIIAETIQTTETTIITSCFIVSFMPI